MKRGIRLIICLLGCCGLSSVAQASNWQVADEGKSGGIWYVDIDSIREISDAPWGAARKAWVKVDWSNDKFERAHESKVLFYFKCGDESSRYVSWIDYDKVGRPISSDTPQFSSYKPVTPETVLHGVMEVVCS